TNLSGNFLKSMSSYLSHTPIRGIKYSSPIFLDTHSLTNNLSVNFVFREVFKYSLVYCIFSVYFLWLVKFNSSPVIFLYSSLIFFKNYNIFDTTSFHPFIFYKYTLYFTV